MKKKTVKKITKEEMNEMIAKITADSSMEEAESFFRARGAITMEELDKKNMALKND